MPLTLHRHPRHPLSRWRFQAISQRDPTDVLSIRPVTPDDRLRQALLFDSMTSEDRHRRFFAPKNALTPAELKASTHVDYSGGFALAAVSRATDRFVACGQFFAMGRGRDCVEAAVVVLDTHKGDGLGSLLVDLLFRAAIEFGAGSLHIEHLIVNKAVRCVFEKAAKQHAIACREGPVEDGICTVTWDLKAEVSAPLGVTERESSHHSVEGLKRKFEVSKPVAHPLSLWQFDLRMRVPHDGQMKTLSVRLVTPDDEAREKSFLEALGPELADLHVPGTCASAWEPGEPEYPGVHDERDGDNARLISEDVDTYARALTHYDFDNAFALAAVDERLDSFVGVARWAGIRAESDVHASLSVAESWRKMGVGSFLFDVLVQSAVQECRRKLYLRAPADVAEVARQILVRHATQVTARPVGGSAAGGAARGDSARFVDVEAALKSFVDHPTTLTRLPGADCFGGALPEAEEELPGGSSAGGSPAAEESFAARGQSKASVVRLPTGPSDIVMASTKSLARPEEEDDDDIWGY